jgi:hypothetical protein
MRRIDGRGLSSGTVKERIAPESVTRALSGFVHRNISRWRLRCGTRSSLARLHKGPISGEILKRCEAWESNQKWERVKPKSRALLLPSPLRPPPQPTPTRAYGAIDCERCFQHLTAHCVLATRGGVAWVMNWVASSVAGPSGVGIRIQNGTRIRVPATGTKAISMPRWAARYLITGRSGM